MNYWNDKKVISFICKTSVRCLRDFLIFLYLTYIFTSDSFPIIKKKKYPEPVETVQEETNRNG